LSIAQKTNGSLTTSIGLTDYEDNKMKKDSLATLLLYNSNQLLSNLHSIVSNLLNSREFKNIFLGYCETLL